MKRHLSHVLAVVATFGCALALMSTVKSHKVLGVQLEVLKETHLPIQAQQKVLRNLQGQIEAETATRIARLILESSNAEHELWVQVIEQERKRNT